MPRGLGRKGAVSVLAIVGMAVVVVAAMADMGVRVLLLAKDIVYLVSRLSEEITESHGGQRLRNKFSLGGVLTGLARGAEDDVASDCGETEKEGLLSREL